MDREVEPALWIVAIILAIGVVGWIGWRTLNPRPPMSREEYIRVRNETRAEIIRRARANPTQAQ
jgi:hypothetical protein